jgi:hypothetical protein
LLVAAAVVIDMAAAVVLEDIVPIHYRLLWVFHTQ